MNIKTDFYIKIESQSGAAMGELLEKAALTEGELVVVGCSSSEIVGEMIGKGSSPQAAAAVLSGIVPEINSRGLFLAAQCCEHLNRALIIERAAAVKFCLEPVNVRPVPQAGGSFASAVYEYMREPVAVEYIQAAAGLDIGSTFIGMHLKAVAVPLRLGITHIGEAYVTAARTRPKYIGGGRAQYVNG